MIYLLDASVLIAAHTQYYPIDRVPEYWEWIRHQASKGVVKLPVEIFEEIKDGPKDKDLLFEWLQDDATASVLLLDDVIEPSTVQHVIDVGYANDLTEIEIDQLGRDPFLIAHALTSDDRCVVTVESSKPKKLRQNRKIPDVCMVLGVKSCNPFEFNKTLGFSTNWKRQPA
jgi:Domain of unknown function (DUF4411)